MTTLTSSSSATPADDLPALARPRQPAGFHPMRSIVQKELRENLKYIFFIQIILGACVFTVLWYATGGFHEEANPDSLLFTNGLPLLTCLSFPAAALLLALGQIYSDGGADIRAFLVHRPVTTTRIFLAKMAAGMILYFLSVGVPLLALFAFAAWTPYGGAIFDLSFTRPYLADFLTGIAYYFTGVLIAQRQARLYGTRLLPLVAALSVSLCVLTLHTFWLALTALALLGSLFALAAWNAYLRNGLDSPLGQPRPERSGLPRAGKLSRALRLAGRLALPGVMVLALATPLAVLSDIWGKAYKSWAYPDWPSFVFVRPPVPHPASTESPQYVSYFIMPSNGQPAIYHWPNERQNLAERWCTDLDGNPLPDPDAPENRNNPRYWASGISFQGLNPRDYWDYSNYRNPGDLLRTASEEKMLFEPYPLGAHRWYYLANRRWFYGFDFHERKPLGTFGATGFLPPGSKPQPFPEDSLPGRYLIMNHVIYEMGFPYGETPPSVGHPYLLPLFTMTSNEPVRRVETGWMNDERGSRSWGGATTDKDINFFESDRHRTPPPFLSLPLDPAMNAYTMISRHLENHHIVFFYQDTDTVVTYDEQGHLLSRVQLPVLPGHNRTAPVKTPIKPGDAFAIGLIHSAGNSLLVHPLLNSSAGIYGFSRYGLLDLPFINYFDFYHGYDDQRLSYFTFDARDNVCYYAGIAAPAFLCAAMVWFLTRRYRFTLPGMIVWSVATLLLGPIGLLVFLFTQPLPARVPCLHCHKKRLVTREFCEHCASPLPIPLTTGTEILAGPLPLPATA